MPRVISPRCIGVACLLLAASGAACGAGGKPTLEPGECAAAAPWRCEPPGMTLVSDYGFEALNAGGWSYRPMVAGARIVQDATDALSPSSVLQFDYPAGFPSAGDAPAAVTPAWPGARREVYWGFNWKASPTFQNHASGVNKLLYGWVNDNVTFGLSFLWDPTLTRPGWQQQLGFFAGGTYLPVNQPACAGRRLTPGTWYRVEFHYRTASRSDVADGSFRLWVDGVLCASHVDIPTLAGPITATYLEPTWGGAGGASMREANYFRFGHVRLSTR